MFEADKVIITKGGDFVGKDYQSDGLYVLNLNNENETSFAYLCDSLDT